MGGKKTFLGCFKLSETRGNKTFARFTSILVPKL